MITFGVLLGLVAIFLYVKGIRKLVKEKRKAILPLILGTFLAFMGAGFMAAGAGSNVKDEAIVTDSSSSPDEEEPAAKEDKEEVAPDTAEEDVVAPEPEPEPEPEVVLEPVTLGTGEFTVGTDIPAGKYVISTQEERGNIATYDSWGLLDVNEMLGTAPDYYVNNITTELEEGGTIKISGLNQVLFTPKQ
ncbi:putative membrane bound protein [Bacillus phage vB_BmeM-Goe8]|uniref:Putative membrane bound protein n=1 Tax=Bacillus phage vB_BmeM-Goe8 TaxID=2593638 RepID=A0A516KN63_9CAUD|nr:putative membrane bound protein [Bacillus phage vB_BmeM-Goe8]YP_009850176.1 putative membrane bound protein [Bacillus phage vB_BmeM-Goe8]QDP42788.1 putative membrane bound protein [Bacillus phage vB_BmeM-Goe8]QDP43015.1 putative membrane bound protein [Bacillus phage vB_BmeM-Goe8]